MSAPAPVAAASKLPLILGVVALLVSLGGVGYVLTKPSTPARTPMVREFTLVMGEGEVLTGINGSYHNPDFVLVPIEDANADDEMSTGEFHRWEPGVFVMFVGDTVKLTVKNPRGNDHSFSIVDITADDFSGTTQTGEIQGKKNSATTTGTEKTIEFTALKPGVYKFVCATPHDHDNNKCDEDHPRMTGYIVVLE